MTEKLDEYELEINQIKVDVEITDDKDRVIPYYEINIKEITDNTKMILKRIREQFVKEVDLAELNREKLQEDMDIKERFRDSITDLIDEFLPNTDKQTKKMLISYLIQENLGLGKLEILLNDSNIEELVVNNHKEPVKIYHKKHGWVETNVQVPTESQIRHYSTMIGRQVDKEITNLHPLMDARTKDGDRVNATLEPISSNGNTITIRKFAEDPWTITKFLKLGTLSISAAAFIWLSLENEMSILVAGGTGSGKTSMLNVVANFLPPSQRVISIEDTRELQLPKNLHWVPMETREPNPEGKGGVSMLDLVVNSLRQRPDRIVVGEIRRKKEAEVLIEAMLTGHSSYATVHANNAQETVTRLTNPPIDIPDRMVSAINLVLVQNRNRQTGKRRTLQLAEITKEGKPRVLLQLDARADYLKLKNRSQRTIQELELYTGKSPKQIQEDLYKKELILKWMVENHVDDIHEVGEIMARYYNDRVRFEELT